jgi:electron transfer flavoprotein beta subunit
MPDDVVVLVSLGMHPVSLRNRVPDRDGRALGLARTLESSVTVVHAGPAAAATILRPCLGMGADRLVVLDLPSGSNPLPALAAWLATAAPKLVLTGDRAETGDGTGMVPFWLAEHLDWGLVQSVVGLELVGSAAHATQALSRGRRRIVHAALPLLVTVDHTASVPPLSAIGPALRGVVREEPGKPVLPSNNRDWIRRPARARPRALSAPGANASAPAEIDRRQMIAPDPVAAADAILDLLERECLIAIAPDGRSE